MHCRFFIHTHIYNFFQFDRGNPYETLWWQFLCLFWVKRLPGHKHSIPLFTSATLCKWHDRKDKQTKHRRCEPREKKLSSLQSRVGQLHKDASHLHSSSGAKWGSPESMNIRKQRMCSSKCSLSCGRLAGAEDKHRAHSKVVGPRWAFVGVWLRHRTTAKVRQKQNPPWQVGTDRGTLWLRDLFWHRAPLPQWNSSSTSCYANGMNGRLVTAFLRLCWVFFPCFWLKWWVTTNSVGLFKRRR